MKKTIGALMVAVSAVAFAASANANDYKPYVAADYTYNDSNFATINAGGKVALGVDYNKYFGTEVFYEKTGSDRVHSEGETDEYSLQSYGLDLYGYLPLGCDQTFALLGTAGISNIDKDYKYEDQKRETDNGLGYRLGAGAQYSFDENLSVRAVARYIFTDKVSDVDHIMEYSAGIKYNF